MTAEMSLEDISFVQVAKKLGATTGSVHYHAGSREEFLSLVINAAYKDIWTQFDRGRASNDWAAEFSRAMHIFRKVLLKHAGVASYLISNNKFRIFQSVTGNEVDYGVMIADRLFSVMRDGGLTKHQAAQCWHITYLFLLSSVQAEVAGTLPSAHRTFLTTRGSAARQKGRDGLAFGLDGLSKLNPEKTFSVGLKALLAPYKQPS